MFGVAKQHVLITLLLYLLAMTSDKYGSLKSTSVHLIRAELQAFKPHIDRTEQQHLVQFFMAF